MIEKETNSTTLPNFSDLTDFSVATFNLFNYLEPPNAFYDFDRIYTAEQWQQKQHWIRQYLQQHSPDIIGFQEVFSAESLQKLVTDCGYPYFHVIEEPLVESDYVYRHPVVGIASKFPVTDVQFVSHDTAMATAMGLDTAFAFSRLPLRATIAIPHLGDTDCYVVHFKSKRPIIETSTFSNDHTQHQSVDLELSTQMLGGWGAAIQRGSEAALLLQQIIARRKQSHHPMILMGDFNNALDDGVLSHLLTDSLRQTSDVAKQALANHYCLQDSWALYQAVTTDVCSRPATHYYGAKGSVLDYILLSNEFDSSHQNNIYEVSAYHTADKHLVNPIYAEDSQSTDHAIVKISLTLRS